MPIEMMGFFYLFVLFFYLQHLGQTLEDSLWDFATELLHMAQKLWTEGGVA